MTDITVGAPTFTTWADVLTRADNTGVINPYIGVDGLVYAADPASGIVLLGKWGGSFQGTSPQNAPAQTLLPGLLGIADIQSPFDLSWLTDLINKLRALLAANPWLWVVLGGLLLLLLERRDRR